MLKIIGEIHERLTSTDHVYLNSSCKNLLTECRKYLFVNENACFSITQ